MIRVIRIIAAAVVILLVSGVLTWYLAFRIGAEPPSSLTVHGLRAPVTIRWHVGGDAALELADRSDLDRTLGVTHAMAKPWSLLLYRQAALGRLSEWYGREALGADHLVHRMGLPTAARNAWDALPDIERRRLEAYAEGVNAALEFPRVRLAPAIAALDIEPERWEPWHALAVERLVAWLGTAIENRSGDAPDVVAFLEARDRLADLLGSGGLDHAAVWHMSGQPPGLYVRWVYGTSGIPPVTVVAVRAPGLQAEYATWIGMPALWAGRDGRRTWAVLPSGHAVVEPGSLSAEPRYERLRLRDGSRDVATVRTNGRYAAVGDAHRIAWSGLAPVSDLSAIVAVASGMPATFHVFDGLAMTIDEGARTVDALGGAVHRADGVTVVSGAPEGRELAAALAWIGEVAAEDVFNIERSAWANSIMEPLKETLVPDSADQASVRVAMQYLRNWDSVFDGASIGATLFDGMVWRNDWPRESAFRAVVDSLRMRFGTDERTWRWESTTADLQYPGFVASGPYRSAPQLPSRYAPVPFPRIGHPTSPAWGTAHPWVSRPAPAAWEAFMDRSDVGTMKYRRPYVPFDRLLGRFSSVPERRALRALRERDQTGSVTRLEPRDS